MARRLRQGCALLAGVTVVALANIPRAAGYIDSPPWTFGVLCKMSDGVVVLKVWRTDADRRALVLEKERDLKGKFPDKIALVVEAETDKEAARTVGGLKAGAEVTAFFLADAEDTKRGAYLYFGGSWYFAMVKKGESGAWAGTAAPVPAMLGVYAGKDAELAGLTKKVLAGEEVVLPCKLGTPKELGAGGGKQVRMRASLKLQTRDTDQYVVPEKR